MVRMRPQICAALASILVYGCAGAPVDTKPNLISDMPSAGDSSAVTGAVPSAAYQLSEAELKYDCKKLTGQMQIRILQMRGYDTHRKASAAARSMQSLATPIWGGTKEGVDPDGQYARDRAMLEAYNSQLAAKKCRTFDLDAELAETAGDLTPAPREKAKPN